MMKRSLNIPDQLAAKLEQDEWLEAYVKAAIAEFTPVLRVNQLTFFPNYTDHGIEHVEEVLNTSFSLVRDEAQDQLHAADAAVLILSTILHDLALHIQKDGIVALLRGDLPHGSLPWFDAHRNEIPWPALWNLYIAEARRFSGRKNKEIFGTADPVEPPALDVHAGWTEHQELLVGDFIRRHHGRLAHEIALFGFPGPATGSPLGLSPKLGDYRDLAGLVARSHTMPLRPCLDYVAATYSGNRRDPRQTHVAFLMGLLRVADYLQVQSSRAPKQLLTLKTIRPPISLGEWHVHHAIADIHTSLDDREAIFIEAHPTDTETYLKIQQLLTGIQAELDQSWAVLGEVYGPIPEKHCLGFVLRRVRSNLDDPTAFASTVDFLPARAAFEAADADLLKLLIAPLYGARPEIGIREMLQNSIDAVRELRDYLSRNPDAPNGLPVANEDFDVIVSVNTGLDHQHWVTITDSGMGMTAEMVRTYFLRAGASFRMSDAWRRQFEDENRHSRILRSGRFGIGVLAAFLLGDEIEVTTRHAAQKRGIFFQAKIDTDPIEIRFLENVPVGTSIRIKISPATYRYLSAVPNTGYASGHKIWDWYHLSEPSVARFIEDQHLQPDPTRLVPSEGAPLANGWYRLIIEGYSDVHWRYNSTSRWDTSYSRLLCNGINIGSTYWRRGIVATKGELDLQVPTLSVFDRDGLLPLRLDRLGLTTEEVPFDAPLAHSIICDIIAFGITMAPHAGVTNSRCSEWYFRRRNHPALRGWPGATFNPAWYSTDQGTALLTSSIVGRSGRGILVYSHSGSGPRPALATTPHAVIETRVSEAKTYTVSWLRNILLSELPGLPRVEAHVQLLIGEHHLNEGVLTRLPKYLQRTLHLISSGNGVSLYSTDPDFSFDYDLLQLTTKGISEAARAKLRVAEWKPLAAHVDNNSLIGNLWEHYVGDVIPFSDADRRKLRNRCYPELKAYIDHWELTRTLKKSSGRADAEF